MRFLPNSPDIPDELIATQERGDVIFICGAGVSRTIGLPSFRGLVEGIYEELGEEWEPHPAEREGMREGGSYYGQYDRVLRSLERRLAASDIPRHLGMRQRIRAAIRGLLAPTDVDLPNHGALLDLSRDEDGQKRLVTTNFDTLFERAWLNVRAQPIASHAGPGMPPPKTAAFSGVLHLHGRLADDELKLEETDLVLTSAEFGEAYLRSAWASRYVYDLARACTIVLVGYQADDPPMRYLLEVLEADRQRYPDLQQVYAFAPIEIGGEEEQRAIWEAKGAQPILYSKAEDGGHSTLYETLREWRNYAEDATAWRRARLTAITNENPENLSDADINEATSLLRHGDASQLLGEVSPAAAWLPVLVSHRIFETKDTHPGQWIATRANDREMIQACAGLSYLDDRSCRLIKLALEHKHEDMTPLRKQAWRLILQAKKGVRSRRYDSGWFEARRRIQNGDIDYEIRRIVADTLRPRLTVAKPFRWPPEMRELNDDEETITHLLQIDYESSRNWSPNEILDKWPTQLKEEIALFEVLARAFDDAIEEAADTGFTTGYDRASADVASVSNHPQNAHRTGFYPITRTLADLWQRVAEKDASKGRELASRWRESSQLLVQRIYLYALSFPNVFTAADAVDALRTLEDRMFWVSDGHREIMRLLVLRWAEFDDGHREIVEKRLREGMPRSLFRPDAYDDDEWASVQEHAVFRRLSRISVSGGQLTSKGAALLLAISTRHPNWQPGEGDRDEFLSWHASRSGPAGRLENLSSIDDSSLVEEALRLQKENPFREGEIWRLLCQAEPDRALRALRSDVERGQWREEAWRPFFWAANDIEDLNFQRATSDLLLEMPNDSVVSVLPSATSWLRRQAETTRSSENDDGAWLLQVWDKLAAVAFEEQIDDEPVRFSDPLTDALNEPGGMLAWTLHALLVATDPQTDNGIPKDLLPRFDRAVGAPGIRGKLSLCFFGSITAYLDNVDPNWTQAKLVPLFYWEHPDAAMMWRARAHDRPGSSRLFNALKHAFLELFERHELFDADLNSLTGHLLSVAMWHRQPESREYDLSPQETRRALASAPPSVRENAAWQLWHWMSEEGEPANKGERWSILIGPFFRDIWPLDARLRDRRTSENLVLMALECDSEFPDAVDAIADVVAPYELFSLDSSLRLERRHSELVSRFPRAFVKLLNELIDPAEFPVPEDLAVTLQQCVEAEPEIKNNPNYIRLYALRRRRGA